MVTASVPAVPPFPWTVADADPADTELVAEFHGDFEPIRQAKYYGADEVQLPIKRVERQRTLRLRRFKNIIVMPHHVIVSQVDGRLLPVSFALYYHKSFLSPGSDDPFSTQKYQFDGKLQAPRVVDEPVFLAEAGYGEYGHMLLEVIPKLGMLAAAPPGTRVIATTSTHSHQPSFQSMFSAFGADSERVTVFRGPLFCSTVYVPDPPLDLSGNIHTVARAGFARVARSLSTSVGPRRRKLFLSRSRMRDRRLTNETEVEAMFSARGFEIVHPERLPVVEQILLVMEAEMVAGLGGSAMHTLAFAAAETKALFLLSAQWFAGIDRYIARADGQYAFVFGTSHRQDGLYKRQWPWTVDPLLVEQALAEHFGL